MKRFDLHMHTIYSDGILLPGELIEECKKLNLEVVSVTDHETVKGIPEAIRIGKKLRIKVIPGIEIAAGFEGKEYHLLAYFIDWKNQELNKFLVQQRKDKVERLGKMVDKLKLFGFQIDLDQVLSRTKDVPGRPHISDVIFSSAYNLFLLEKLDLKESGKFFRAFLAEEGKAYSPQEKPSIEEVIELIDKVGGMSVWAHSFWKGTRIEEIREKAAIFKKFGLRGLEVLYPFYSREQTLAIHQLAGELSLIESGGSDFHGRRKSKDKIAGFKKYGIQINFPFEKEV